MVCDFTNEAREHVEVALSLLGTENEKKVKALGVTQHRANQLRLQVKEVFFSRTLILRDVQPL
eukprot:103463-Hanusia_phi.AAC.1